MIFLSNPIFSFNGLPNMPAVLNDRSCINIRKGNVYKKYIIVNGIKIRFVP